MAMATNVGGFTDVDTFQYTRPNNTTAYVAGRVVANSTSAATAMSWALGRPGSVAGTGLIVSAFLIDESNPGTPGQFELWLFNQALSAVINDNAVWLPAAADLANLIGVIAFGTTSFAGGTGSLVFQPSSPQLPFEPVAPGLTIYGQLVVRNAYTPAANGVILVGLGALQD